MADAARKEKLAAAKKKLKNFQRSGQSSSPAPTNRNRKPNNNNNTQGKGTDSKAPENPTQGVTNGSGDRSPPPQPFQGPQHTSTPKITNKQGKPSKSSTLHPSSPASPAAAAAVNHSTHDRNATSAATATGPTTASTERIQQLSLQLNGLLSETSALVNDDQTNQNGSLEALELRNRDLATLVEKHMQANEQLAQQLDDLKYTNSKLQTSFDSERKGFEDKLKRELGALKEQLQVHIQTIGILVAEKTELQSSLNQSQKQSEQRLEELEELSGRLKASRQRVGDLERSFTAASTGKQKQEQDGADEWEFTTYRSSKELGKEVDRLKLELYKTNKSNEEFQQKNSELQGKLQKKVSECTKMEEGLIEVKGKLEMSELNLQQLQNGSATPQDPQTTQQIEALLTEKSQLLARIDQYEQQFERVSQERDHISQQYQEYIQQITQQSQTLQLQIKSLVAEKEELLDKQRELEVIIQDLKSNQDSAELSASEAKTARQELAEKVEKMVMEVGELKHKYETQIADNSQLSRLVMEKEEHIGRLEMQVSQLSDNQVDKDSLLESIQNDKTALSRAMAQNKELKHQLAELQNGFVKMSNENMEMLTKYTSEQHVAKELGARLVQQEDELREIREQCTQKEQLLQEMQKYAERLQQQSDHHHHPSDMEQQLVEFQQATPLIETLQKELSSAQDTINTLTNQNGELRSQILQDSSRDINMNTNTEQVETMTASIRQLELERNQIVSILQDEKQSRQTAEKSLEQLQQELATMTPATLNGDVINKAQFEALQHAMKQLEGKYTKAMRDKADLTDKSEQLEHIIMQLQGETDTIAEYITLYQTQRMLLRQRQEEKDDYISRLAREREDQSDKVSQLQGLLVQLLNERNASQAHQGGLDASLGNHVPHSVTKRPTDSQIAGKLDSSHLEDWPDYTSSDSDASEVEPIVGGPDEMASEALHSTPLRSAPKSNRTSHATEAANHVQSGPQVDATAQKIMNLLTEIGSSVHADTSNDELHNSFLHCSHCSGRVFSV